MMSSLSTEEYLADIADELRRMRWLVEEFLMKPAAPAAPSVAISQPAAIETDSLLFDTKPKKVKYAKSKGLKRKFYSADVKASVLHSVLQCNKTPEAAAEFYGVHLNTLRHWIGAATKGTT